MLKRFLLALALFATLSPAHAGEFTGPRRALLSAGCPAAVKVGGICPTAGCNFTTGTCYAAGSGILPVGAFVSTTRASSHLCQYASGVWTSVGSNTACITDQGFLIEEARTNKCTNYNANPPALVTPTTLAAFNAAVTNAVASGGDGATLFGVVDDTSAIATGGLQNVTNSRVYKIDNSAGAVTANITFSGQTGNTNAHSMSIFARGTLIYLRDNNSSGQVGPFNPAAYTRITSANYTPTSSARSLQVSVTAGGVGYAILNDLEEGSFVTSPIVVAGASATRAADIPTLIGPAATAALAAKSLFAQTYAIAGGTGPQIFNINTNQITGYPSSTQVTINNGSASVSPTIGGSGNYSGTVKSAYGFDATSMTAVANGGTKGTSATPWTPGGSAYLGNRSAGDRALNGYMQVFDLSTTKGIFDNSTQLPYLLKRDVIPGTPANDNTPMFLYEAA